MTANEPTIDWSALEAIVHCDPAGRGMASFRQNRSPLDAGQLRAAAEHLATHATRFGIVTGFCVRVGDRVAAETDGPPGALYLARAMLGLGVDVRLIGDAYSVPLLKAGCDRWQLGGDLVVEFPFGPDADVDRWVEQFFGSGVGAGLSHLIAIERAGPSHTLDSVGGQLPKSAALIERFSAQVPADDRDIPHNMRGESIAAHTAKTHRLFDWIHEHRQPITTIGIGDGGNEIGMGRYPWELLVEAIGSEPAARIACRIATDFTLLAGVSNWAAYALALSVCRLRGRSDLARSWTPEVQRSLIETLVRDAGAVDGLTLRAEAAVDGLPLDVYLEPLAQMQQTLVLR